MVPAPRLATLLVMKVMSAAELTAIAPSTPVGLTAPAATGTPCSRLLAPPRMLTRSRDPKVPPAPV